jgi:glycosyltransferase involved in cell wall biosynthesis
MMSQPHKIYFINEGKAFHPTIPMNMKFFGDRFACEEVTFAAATQKTDLAQSICWYTMGFYPKKLPAAITIHDYKSFSVAPLRWLKDQTKLYLNARPDIRIMTGPIHQRFHFNDNVPCAIQEIGVPDDLISQQQATAAPTLRYDFGYVGVITRERKLHLVIDSFLRYCPDKTFLLIGNPESWIYDHYRNHANVIFVGQKPQREAFELLRQARVTVCYFPNHYPHLLQIPTKLLDAAALKQKILANPQTMNLATAQRYKIQAHWSKQHTDLFADLPDFAEWPHNDGLDPSPFYWSNVMRESGLPALLEQCLKR